ncbi:MAG: hypothetical protein KAT05_15355 [Spirochaetes bacterium]|nr:hypothetical protein [Spirochaetota bacterium]
MEYQKGEIHISPKTIFWVEMPDNIKDHDKIELLKKDILLVKCSGVIQELVKLREKNSKSSAFFYNLDQILHENHIKNSEAFNFLHKIVQFIKTLSPEKTLVHTTIIDKKISELFRDEGIIYVEKNLNDKKIAESTILALIHPLFSEHNKVKRSFLRLNLLPMKYKVAISNISRGSPVIKGCLKDLSLNGMGIVLNDKNELNFFSLKNLIEIKIFIRDSILTISKAFITRVDDEKIEIGVNYDISDNSMVREDYATYLTGLIYNWIKELLEKYGHIDS